MISEGLTGLVRELTARRARPLKGHTSSWDFSVARCGVPWWIDAVTIRAVLRDATWLAVAEPEPLLGLDSGWRHIAENTAIPPSGIRATTLIRRGRNGCGCWYLVSAGEGGLRDHRLHASIPACVVRVLPPGHEVRVLVAVADNASTIGIAVSLLPVDLMPYPPRCHTCGHVLFAVGARSCTECGAPS